MSSTSEVEMETNSASSSGSSPANQEPPIPAASPSPSDDHVDASQAHVQPPVPTTNPETDFKQLQANQEQSSALLLKNSPSFATANEDGVSLAFRTVGYQVQDDSDRKLWPVIGQAKKVKVILSGVSGVVQPGQCCAILGSSGSGKTTLLDILAGNISSKFVSGDVYYGGVKATARVLKENCGYVMQDDSHLTDLTVKETLVYSALLRLPAAMPWKKKLSRADAVIGILGLRHVENTKIGGSLIRGISGGERRRVSIGVQMLKDPKILLLDEPTTGLDTFTASHIINTLSHLASLNKTIIFTVHQPRSSVFPQLDMVMLLSLGKSVYFGPRSQMIPHFSSIGFPCDVHSNPLDHYIDVVTVDKRSEKKQTKTEERLVKLTEDFEKSKHHRQLLEAIEGEIDLHSGEPTHFVRKPRANPFVLFYILTARLFVNLGRSSNALSIRITQLFMFAVVIWIFIFRFKDDQASIQNRSGFLYETIAGPVFIGALNAINLFPEIRNLFYRENRDKLYSPVLFITTYVASTLPTSIIATFLYSGFSYWAMGLYPDAGRYFIFTAAVFLMALFGEISAVAFLGLIYDPSMANSVLNLLSSISVLLGSGFLRSYGTIPDGLLKIAYITIQRYASEVVFANEFHKLELQCDPDAVCSFLHGDDYLARLYPNSQDNYLRNFLVMTGFSVITFFLCMIVFAVIKPKLR